MTALAPQTSDDPIAAVYARTVGLLRYIAVIVFRVPEEDADAIVHDTYVAYLTAADSIRDPKPWLVATVRNAARLYWRKQGRELPLPADSVTWADPRPDREQVRKIDYLAAAAVIERLPERDRDLLERFYLNEESTEAIAREMGTSSGTVQVFLHHSRKRAQALYRDLMRGAR